MSLASRACRTWISTCVFCSRPISHRWPRWRKAASAANGERRIMGSAYLGAVVPDSAEVHNLLGLALMRDGELEAAIREFQMALSKDPRSPNARANLGQIRLEQGSALLELPALRGCGRHAACGRRSDARFRRGAQRSWCGARVDGPRWRGDGAFSTGGVAEA